MAPKRQYSGAYSQGRGSSQAVDTVPASVRGPRILLLLISLALVLIGLVMVYSSSSIVALNEGKSMASYLFKQALYAVFGIAGAFVIWKCIAYRWWKGPFVWAAWLLTIVLLVLTVVLGEEEYGAQRWLRIGPVGIQSSEIVKIVFLIMAARILDDYRDGRMRTRDALAQGFLLIIVPLLFLYKTQSDLGSTLICLVGILMVMWLGEVPWRMILGIIALGIVFVAIASTVGYRQNRFTFINPWNDGKGGLGTGYQLIHSFYAFSEGGLFGVGLGNSREKFLYLPMSETDFIFSIIGEELGLVGALVVILLFLAFLFVGMRIARHAPDAFGMMIAGGLTAMIVFQAFLNIGCALGVFPTTGKPLPFISSGGSSLIASLWMVGIILSVSHASGQDTVYNQRRDDLRVVRYQSSPDSTRRGFSGKESARTSPSRENRSTRTSFLPESEHSGQRQKRNSSRRAGSQPRRSN